MKNNKVIVIITVFLLLSFICTFCVATNLLYTPSLCLGQIDSDFLNDYFKRITKEPIYSNATAQCDAHYTDIGFSYGDVIKELATYSYTPVQTDAALSILKAEGLDKNAYRVYLYPYSTELDDLGIVNAVYFAYEEDIYTLVFLNNTKFLLSDNTDTGDFYSVKSYDENISVEKVLYKSDMKDYPESISSDCFENPNLISSWLEQATTRARNKAKKIALITTIAEVIIIAAIIIVKRKDNQSMIR
ncbi:MAG: hypothetical protein IKV76_07815 [Clostridia bacterium]|nr:hypothetical protein [Clostridia bacterium]